ncbi:MAG: tetratricopeptide repeat protein, partial [Methylococcaceae bacterium]|nr:tetratricopeptide repeat protein [Methylococcaceae bacterium]
MISIIKVRAVKRVLLSVFLICCFDIHAAAVSDQQQALFNQVKKLYQAGDKQSAQQQLEQAIEKVDTNKLAARPFLYQSHLLLVKFLAKNAEYTSQLQVLQKVMALLNQWQLGKTVDAVTVQQNIAQVLLQLGQEKKAIDAFKESLQLAWLVYSAKDLRISNILLSLAKAHANRLQVEISERYFTEIETALEGQTGKQVELMRGRLLQAKGELVFRQVKTKQAVEFYRQALKQREQLLGTEHLETAQTISSLAGAVKGLHEFSEADELYRRAFAIYEKALGAEHPFIATLLNNIGQLYYLEGRYQESEKVLLRAIAIKKQRLGEEHPLLADSYNHLGYLYYLLEKDELALELFAKAIKTWSSPQFFRPRYAASAEIWVAVIHHRQGQS